MKILLTGSDQYPTRYLNNFLNERGFETQIITRSKPSHDGISFESIAQNGLPECDVVINFPENDILPRFISQAHFEREFKRSRIEHTALVRDAIAKSPKPPKVWISLSSVGYYSKDEEQFFREDDPVGNDPIGKLIQEWEEAAKLPENHSTRSLILRMGLLVAQGGGVLPGMLPFFKFGLGFVVGKGDESFPWIYSKDLFWFILHAIEKDDVKGVFNMVAPQIISSQNFSEALSKILHKPILLRFPRKFYQKRFGATADIIFAKSKMFPSRILKTGFEFRYPAIYPAIVDAINKGS